jgi:hypothetical protein
MLGTRTLVSSGAACVVLMSAAVAPDAWAATIPPVDVSSDDVTCDSVVGQMKFLTPLTVGGSTATAISVKATLDGCVDQTAGVFDADTNPNGASLGPSKLKGELLASSSDCLDLPGLAAGTSGQLEIKWKGNTKDLLGNKIPKLISSDPSGKAISTVTVNELYGGTYVAEGLDSTDGEPVAWDASHSGYGLFQFGADAAHHTTAAPSVSGAFGGDNGGIASYLDTTTGESQSAIAAACFGKGLKKLNLGVGQIRLGGTLQCASDEVEIDGACLPGFVEGLGWETVAGPGISEIYPTPYDACERQHEVYNPGAFPFDAVATPDWWVWACTWPAPPGIAGTDVHYVCPDDYILDETPLTCRHSLYGA